MVLNMKKILLILCMVFLFAACGESHHQIKGTVEYALEGDTVVYITPFTMDYHFKKSFTDGKFNTAGVPPVSKFILPIGRSG